MTTLTLEPTTDLHLFGDGGGEATLADVIAGAWEDLAAARAVACPICAGELAPGITTPAGELVVARCADCGAQLD